MDQHSYSYMTTGKTLALTIWTIVCKAIYIFIYMKIYVYMYTYIYIFENSHNKKVNN